MIENGTSCLSYPCQHGGSCLTNGIEIICECLPCFTGLICEQNITKLIPIYAILSYTMPTSKDIFFILLQVFVITILIDNLLSIQTILLSKKILITNIGVYLSILSCARIIVGIIIQIIIVHHQQYINHTLNYILISITLSFFYISIWLSSLISIERLLIQMKYFNVHLYDSRRRSLIISTVVVLFVFITKLIIPGVIFFNKKGKFNDKLETFIRAFLIIHHIIPFTLHLIASIVVLIHLIKHQRKFKVNHRISDLFCKQIRKHRDFFVQSVIYICFTLPLIIIVLTGVHIDDDCTKITFVRIEVLLFFYLFFTAIIFVFPVYICSSKVYLIEFRNSSLIGQFHMKIKNKCKKYFLSNQNTEINTYL